MSSFHSVSYACRSSESTHRPEPRHSSSSEMTFGRQEILSQGNSLPLGRCHLFLRKRSTPQYSSNFHRPHIRPQSPHPMCSTLSRTSIPTDPQKYPPTSPAEVKNNAAPARWNLFAFSVAFPFSTPHSLMKNALSHSLHLTRFHVHCEVDKFVIESSGLRLDICVVWVSE
jgi:hypothetical protein